MRFENSDSDARERDYRGASLADAVSVVADEALTIAAYEASRLHWPQGHEDVDRAFQHEDQDEFDELKFSACLDAQDKYDFLSKEVLFCLHVYIPKHRRKHMRELYRKFWGSTEGYDSGPGKHLMGWYVIKEPPEDPDSWDNNNCESMTIAFPRHTTEYTERQIVSALYNELKLAWVDYCKRYAKVEFASEEAFFDCAAPNITADHALVDQSIALLLRFANLHYHGETFPLKGLATETDEHHQHLRNQLISSYATMVGAIPLGIAATPIAGMIAMKSAMGAGAEVQAQLADGDFDLGEVGQNATEMAFSGGPSLGIGWESTLGMSLGVSVGKMAAQGIYQHGLFGLEQKLGPLSFQGQKEKAEARRKARARMPGHEDELGDITRPRTGWKEHIVEFAQNAGEMNKRIEQAIDEDDRRRILNEHFVNHRYGDEQKSIGRRVHETLFAWTANSAALEPYEKVLGEIRKTVCAEIVNKLVRDTGYKLPGHDKSQRKRPAKAKRSVQQIREGSKSPDKRGKS